MSDAIKHVSDATFDKDVLQSGNPVLVDFWAEWCGPCKMIAPVLDEIAKEYGDKLTIAKLDIDANPSTPGKYGIRGIPTVILYKDGQAHAQKVGALTGRDDLVETAVLLVSEVVTNALLHAGTDIELAAALSEDGLRV